MNRVAVFQGGTCLADAPTARVAVRRAIAEAKKARIPFVVGAREGEEGGYVLVIYDTRIQRLASSAGVVTLWPV